MCRTPRSATACQRHLQPRHVHGLTTVFTLPREAVRSECILTAYPRQPSRQVATFCALRVSKPSRVSPEPRNTVDDRPGIYETRDNLPESFYRVYECRGGGDLLGPVFALTNDPEASLYRLRLIDSIGFGGWWVGLQVENRRTLFRIIGVIFWDAIKPLTCNNVSHSW